MWKIKHPSVHGKEYAKKAKELINKTLNKEIDTMDLISEMLEMENRYPDLGWVENAFFIHIEFSKRMKMPIPDQTDYVNFKRKPLLNELFCSVPRQYME